MQIFKMCSVIFFISLILLSAAPSRAALLWDETIDGDFSNLDAAPTHLFDLAPGTHQIFGSIGGHWTSDPRDVVTFVVPGGYLLSQFIFEDYSHGTSYDYAPFSLFRGASVEDPMVEFILLTERSSGTDLLQFDSRPGPQPAGIYTFRFNSIHTSTVNDERSPYSLNLNIAPVPEPATILLLGFGLAGLVGGRYAKKKI